MVNWSGWECRNTDIYSWLRIIGLATGPELFLAKHKELNLEQTIYFKAFLDTFTKYIIC